MNQPYAQTHETHTGLVVLVGNRAYKSKRPVVTDFLDFGTAAQREKACARELELNSRLAPQAYLGLAHLDGPGGADREPVLVMHRYPDSARLSTRVAAGGVTDVEAVAVALADFHEDAKRGREIEAAARVPAIRKRWTDNLAELDSHAGTLIPAELLDEVKALSDQYLSGRAVLFADRQTLRRIVDGHGDLMADDIFCLPDGPVLLDCLDFDDALRYVDGIDDAAFLAMDLEFLGRPDLADAFVHRYRTRAGDFAPQSLWDFYIAYRAVVRAKVDCIRCGQGHDAVGDAERHLTLAVEHLRAAVPQLVVVGGGPGTGKTTLATSLAEELDAQVISTDEVRRELQQDQVIEGAAGELGVGLYSPENVAMVYKVVLRKAHSLLASGQSVVLDGTWRDAGQREQARATAAKAHAGYREMVCVAPLEAAQGRIAERNGGSSDATPAIAAALTDGDAWAGLRRIDTTRPLVDSVAEARELCAPGR